MTLCKVKLSFGRLLLVLILKQNRVCGSDVLLVVVVANNLHVVKTELDFDTLVG